MALKKGKYYHKLVEFEITDSTNLTDLNWVLKKYPELKDIITTLSEGYYSFTLPSSDTSQLIDDTYLYTITQGEQSLKTGEVRRLLIVPIAGGFDYTLDFELA